MSARIGSFLIILFISLVFRTTVQGACSISSVTVINQTNCANPDGSMTVASVSPGNINNYTFVWYLGSSSTTGTLVGAGITLSNRAAGTYTVVGINNNNGCITPDLIVTILDQTVTPVIGGTTVTDNTFCVGSNGALEVTSVTPGLLTDYTFTWYDGTNTVITGETTPILSTLAPGNYSVEATNNTTGCVSPSVNLTVNDISAGPTVNLTITDQTICSPPNGSLQAVASGGGVSGYSYVWYDGIGTGSPAGVTADTYSGLAAGNYTVVVTDIETGCTTETTGTVSDNTVIPIIDGTTVTDNSYCVGNNGALEVTSVAPGLLTDYTFTWYDGTNTVIPGQTGPTLTGLAPGNYSVEATSNTSSCLSAAVPLTVNDVSTGPTVNITNTDQTSCTTPNGSLQAVASGGGTLGYTYAWYNGIGTGSPAGVTTDTYSGLAAGDYTVVVTDTETGCTTETSASVVDNIVTPAINGTTVTDNTFCVGNNGALEVTSVSPGLLTDYTFTWYDGTNTVIPGQTGPTLSTLAPGNYSVEATNNTTACVSALVPLTVNDVSAGPTVNITNTDQTSCGTANGSLLAVATGGGTLGYTYAWYNGIGTGSPAGVTADTYSALAAGDYTVVVTDTETGCTTEASATVTDNIVTPVIDGTTVTDNTFCVGNNGALEVTSVSPGLLTDYTFTWYDGTNTVIPGQTGPTLIGLAPGNYSVEATRNTSSCLSAAVPLTVNDVSAGPTVNITNTDQTSCGTANGSLQAVASGGGTLGYTYAWYNGIGTGSPAGVTTDTYSGLAAGDYTVVVTDTETGCTTEASATVTDNIVTPVIAGTTTTDNSFCVGSNGALEVTSVTPGILTDYTFTWYDGTNTVITGETGPTLSTLAPGNYSVEATNNTTACVSALVPLTVNDVSAGPAVNFTITDQTSCGTANGSLLAVASGGGTLGYTYAWYNGIGTGSPAGVTADTYSALAAGDYTVVVTDTETGCTTEANATVVDNIIVPLIVTENITDITCAGSGSIEITGLDSGVPSDYTYQWYTGTTADIANLISSEVSATLSVSAAGNYTVVAVNSTTNCNTSPFTVNVSDVTGNPTVSIAVVDQSSCDPSNPNGSVTASATGIGSLGFSYEWFIGTDDSTPAGVTTASYSNVAGGDYTVKVTDNETQCFTLMTATIPDNAFFPQISATSVTDVSSCQPLNGSAAVTLMQQGALSDYTYTWYTGSTPTPTNEISGETSESISGLDAGSYTVVATNTFGCASAPVVVNILDLRVNPSITLSYYDQTSCDLSKPNGIISAIAKGSSGTLGYTYQWWNGTDTSGTPDFTGDIYTGLAAGTYTVSAEDNETHCKAYKFVALKNSTITFQIQSSSVDPSLNCGTGSGTITINFMTVGTLSDYDFHWYTGTAVDPANLIANETGPVLSNLSAGDYTVQPESKFTFCLGDPQMFTVEDQSELPTVFVSRIPVTSCDASNPNGSISTSVTVVGGSGYTTEWWIGTDTSGAPDYTQNHIFGLSAGTYTLRVTDNATQCTFEESIDVLEDITIPSVTNSNVTAQTDCNSPNGSITISSVSGNDPGGYSYQWYKIVDTQSQAISGATSATLLNQPAGDYSVEITDASSTCVSAPILFTIPDNGNCITSLDDLAQNLNFQVYPNPSNGEFVIDLPNPDKAVLTIYISDMMGRLVMEQQSREEVTRISSGNLRPGTYILTVGLGGKVYQKKVFIEN